jgi:hypothetical protein
MRMPYGNHGADTRRPAYRPGYPGRGQHERGRWDRDHDRHGRDRSWAFGSFGYGYPGWAGNYPYPFVVNPWLDDWSDADQSGNDDQGGYPAENANVGSSYNQGPPYADDGSAGDEQPYAGDNAPAELQQPSAPRQEYGRSTASAAARPEESLTVIFKDGRAPETVQNYMISSNALTVLDRDHHEQIPLDQIDVAATQKANRARGMSFQVPAPAGD